jgi:hypothetical protein
MKEAVCRLVDEGHGLTSAARIVGVSPRTVSREKDRDPLFKRRLHQGREGVARLCHKTMEAAAGEKWQAAERYYKLVYPERYYYKPETMPLKLHDAFNNELFELLKDIMTDDQMRELDRALKSRSNGKKPAA